MTSYAHSPGYQQGTSSKATKFNPGDMVRCNNKDSISYIYGEVYEVKDTYESGDGERIHTVLDSEGSTTNGWGARHFDLAYAVKEETILTAPTVLGTQVGGTHYTDCAIQPIEYIWANKLGFSEGNIVKYVTRWKSKGGIKDLEKAKHHISLLIEHESAK